MYENCYDGAHHGARAQDFAILALELAREGRFEEAEDFQQRAQALFTEIVLTPVL